MKSKNTVKTILLAASIWLASSVAEAQVIEIEPVAGEKTFAGQPAQARVDFISRSSDLKFKENAGETVQSPQQRDDSLYVYTCICDVNDKNKFGFNISLSGMVTPQFQSVYIEEGQLLEYNVFVRNIRVRVTNDHAVIREENTSLVTLTSASNSLKVESPTAAKVVGPVLNDNQTYDYKVYFELSAPENREREHKLKIFSGDDEAPYEHLLGRLAPKQGIDIAVIVIGRNCYDNQIALAQQHFRNGVYHEARDVYKKLVETNDCSSKPIDLSDEQKKIMQMDSLYRYFLLARHQYNRALDFRKNGLIDSCMHCQAEAFTWRNLILKHNPADPYCLEHNREYYKFVESIGRIVSGKILDNTRMDMQGNNLPVPNTYIVLCTHENKLKKINGVEMPGPGKEKKELRKLLGQTSVDGSFKVSVPRNTAESIYRLIFVASREDYGIASDDFDYVPTDNDVISDLKIRINPKGLNSVNKR
ncbi:MAG: hypothetical protein LBK96_04815 [Prevotellaceae bacterium]|jgi:hypothetical protein|nr:hypothetical protein [Prevotellaceae bacterium]